MNRYQNIFQNLVILIAWLVDDCKLYIAWVQYIENQNNGFDILTNYYNDKENSVTDYIFDRIASAPLLFKPCDDNGTKHIYDADMTIIGGVISRALQN